MHSDPDLSKQEEGKEVKAYFFLLVGLTPKYLPNHDTKALILQMADLSLGIPQGRIQR